MPVLCSIMVDGETKNLSSYLGYKMLGVNPLVSAADTQRLLAAHNFARYLSSKEVQEKRFDTFGIAPTNKEVSALEKVKAAWSAVKNFWNSNIAKYFTATWWGNLGKNAINGLIRWIVNGLNKLVDKINSFGFNLPDVLGGGRVGFNIPKLQIPQLAKGAVLPPNKPFLAMVGDQKSGTNVEAPLDTIVEAVKIALGGSNGFSGRIEVPVYLGNRQIALAIREAENELGTETVTGGFANAY